MVGLSMLIIIATVAGATSDRLGARSSTSRRGRRARLSMPHQRGLRLDGDHAGAEPAERGDAVADMGADIEHQIAAA